MKQLLFLATLACVVGCASDGGAAPPSASAVKPTDQQLAAAASDPNLTPEAKAQLEAARQRNAAMSAGMQRMQAGGK